MKKYQAPYPSKWGVRKYVAQEWRCDICARTSPWTTGHRAEGTVADIAAYGYDGMRITCGASCREG